MTRGAIRHISVVGVMTLISRVTGLLRDMVYARMLPTGTGLMDAFLVAYQIPNYLRRLFAEGAFSQAFVPVVAEYRVRQPHEAVRELIDSVAGTLGLLLSVISILGVLAAPVLIWLFAPGFSQHADKFELAAAMLRWTFPFVLFISLTALAGGVLNCYQRFALPAFTSVLLNLIMIVFAAFIAPHVARPGIALAIGVLVAGVVQLCVQVPPLIKLGLIRRPRWNWGHAGVRRIGTLMLPAILGSSMGQLSVLLSSVIASFLATGSIAWLYYADRVVEFPLGVFSIALATVILPSLSAHHAAQSAAHFSNTLEWALRLLCVVVLPAAVALCVLAEPITVTLFHGGQFNELDVRMTTQAVMAYSFALLGWSLVKVLSPGYFARQDTKTPVRTAMQSFGLTMLLNLMLMLWLLYQGRLHEQGMHTGLAVTVAIGALANALQLYQGLRRQGVLQLHAGWLPLLVRITLANMAMAVFLYFCVGRATWLPLHELQRVWQLLQLVLGGVTVYFVSLWLCGWRLQHLKQHI